MPVELDYFVANGLPSGTAADQPLGGLLIRISCMLGAR
jgi:hypothetical protein